MKRRLLNIKDTSEYVALCPETIRDLIAERKFPFINISKGQKPCYRFDLKELDKWVDRLPGITTEELNE